METHHLRENLSTLSEWLRGQADEDGPLLAEVVYTIALASKSIAHKIRRARIEDILGEAGGDNVHGEAQQKLDVLANDLLLDLLGRCPHVGVCGSEEEDEAVVARSAAEGGRYCVLFDPLDGSSNIDVAVSVGTIFSILPNDTGHAGTEAVLQPGHRQRAAGYVVYGSSVLMALTLGDGVALFVLDPDLGEYVLVEPNLRMPGSGKIYSVNEGYSANFPAGYQRYLQERHGSGYSLRYIGSMIGDVHRTLLKGGVFMYPPTTDAPSGKLRLLYEGNPMGMLVEQAGGAASTGSGRIMDVVPQRLHERTPVVLGSSEEVDAVIKML